MDPITIITVSAGFAASCVAQKCADAAIEKAWKKIQYRFESVLGRYPEPADLAKTANTIIGSLPDDQFDTVIESVYSASPALRRARAAENYLNSARILWIDDHHEGNAWERATLSGFGADIMFVETTSAAIECLKNNNFDLVISDITRDNSADTGLEAIPVLRKIDEEVRFVFYIMDLDTSLGTPPGAFGITNDPEELLHLIVDIMERKRS